jgi:hypothetical protein
MLRVSNPRVIAVMCSLECYSWLGMATLPRRDSSLGMSTHSTGLYLGHTVNLIHRARHAQLQQHYRYHLYHAQEMSIPPYTALLIRMHSAYPDCWQACCNLSTPRTMDAELSFAVCHSIAFPRCTGLPVQCLHLLPPAPHRRPAVHACPPRGQVQLQTNSSQTYYMYW